VSLVPRYMALAQERLQEHLRALVTSQTLHEEILQAAKDIYTEPGEVELDPGEPLVVVGISLSPDPGGEDEKSYWVRAWVRVTEEMLEDGRRQKMIKELRGGLDLREEGAPGEDDLEERRRG